MVIEINRKKLFDDIYGKVPPEEYKRLYVKYFTIKSMIEEKYNKLVHCVQAVSVDKDYAGVEYDPVGYYSMKDLMNKIREIEKEGKIFAGLDVFFKDHSET